MVCVWQETPSRRKPQLHRKHGYNKDFAVPSEMTGSITVFAVPSTSLTERLISHFLECSPNWVSSIHCYQGAQYLCNVIPSALDSQLILDCVLAVAAGDLCKTDDDCKELEKLSYEYYSHAAVSLSSAVAKEAVSFQDGHGADSSGMATLHAFLAFAYLEEGR